MSLSLGFVNLGSTKLFLTINPINMGRTIGFLIVTFCLHSSPKFLLGLADVKSLIFCVKNFLNQKKEIVRTSSSLSLKTAMLFSIIVLISGCAAKRQPTITPEASTKIKRVAVVSVVAETFSRQHVGITIDGNESEQLGIADWKIDEHVEARMRSELEQTYKFVAVNTPYPRGDFFQVNKLVGKGPTTFMEPDWKAIKSVTQDFCSKNSLDAVFVLAKIYANVPGRTAIFGGAGLYTDRNIFSQTANIFFVSKLALIDCATGNPLQVRVFSTRQSKDYRYVYRWLPIEEIDSTDARTPINEWSNAQSEKIRAQLKLLPEKAISETLKNIFPQEK